MTFPGESIGVVGFDNTSGTPVTSLEEIAYRAGSCTFTAGDAVTLTVDLGDSLLVDGDTSGVDIVWAVEVLSGAGTLNGVSITDAGTYLLPSTVTVADILANEDADLDLECTSGTVVVQQVKLRVWPSGGVVGGLSAPWQPPDQRRNVNSWGGSSFTVDVGIADHVGDTAAHVLTDMQDSMRAALAVDTIGAATFVDTTTPMTLEFTASAVQYDEVVDPQAFSFQGRIAVGVSYGLHPDGFRGDFHEPPGDFGVDWIYPPDEVYPDPDVWRETEPGVWGWWQGQAMLRTGEGMSEDAVVSGNVNVAVGFVEDIDDPATAWTSLLAAPDLSVNAPNTTPWQTIDLPPAEPSGYLRFVGWHDGALAEQGVAFTVPLEGAPAGSTYFTGESIGTLAAGIYDSPEDETLDRIAFRYTPAPIRYWVPGVLQPHQIFQRKDNLGAGSSTVFDPSTRQSSSLVFGTY